jgi:polysaccharide biosynthesis transport protein
MDDTEIDLRSLFGVLRRQARLIVVTVIAVVAIAGIALFALTPIYSSSALVLFDPSSKNLLEPETQLTSSSADSARIDSEVELLRSDNILLKVIAAENLTSDPEFGASLGLRNQLLIFLRLMQPALPTGEEALNQSLTKLRNAFTVQRRGLTYLISIQARSKSPATAARLANAIAQTYIADQLSSKVNSMLASRDILQARILQARDAIVASEGAFDNFITQNLQRITEDTGRTDIALMQTQIEQLQSARNQSADLVSAVNADIEAGNWQAIVTSLQSDALAELERQRDELSQSLSTTAEGSPTAVNLRAELAAIEGRLRQTSTEEVTALRDSINSSQDQEAGLRQNLRREVLGSSLSADILTQLYELQQRAEIARSQYQTLLSRSQDLETQANLQIADSRIVSAALPSQQPSFPNNPLILAMAALLSLGIGVGLAFLYENLIGGFMSEEQVEAVLKTRVATAVPREKPKSERDSLANLMVTAPMSVYSESVRRMRAAIEQVLQKTPHKAKDEVGKVIMVTSTAPNEGKTTLCLSLARSYALSGRRTLLIDCDLRKPSVHRQLEFEPSQGLLEVLSDMNADSDLRTIMTADKVPGLTIIVGARRSDLPTDQLLAGQSFKRLISAARRSFDIVILDTPPVGPVVDGLYIAPHSDLIVFVTRWASTSQRDAKLALASLAQASGPDTQILTVLNQQNETRGSYRRKYGSYYEATS